MKPARVVFISPHLAVRDYHGGCAYAAAILEALHAAGCEILHVWLADLRGRRPFRVPLLPGGGKVKIPGALALGRWVIPLPFAKPHLGTFLRRLTTSVQPALAILDRAPTAAVWEKHPDCPAWVLTIDSLHQRASLYEAHGFEKDFEHADATREQALLARADGIIAIQDDEARLFQAMLPKVPVVTVPHPVRSDPLPLELSSPGSLLFIGGSAVHNVDGIQWFVREILPLILREQPEAILEIAGTVGNAVPDHPAIRKLGRVGDLRPLYQRAQLCIAPLRFGTGLKIKVVEAMGYGRPVVGTPVAAEGFADLPAALATVSEQPEALAQAIVDLLRDESLRRAAVARQFDWVRRHVEAGAAIQPLLEQIRKA